MTAVGRPLGRMARAAREEKALARRAAVDREDEDLPVALVGDTIALRREDGCVALGEQLRRAARKRNCKDLDVRLYRAGRRIRREAALGGPVRVVIAAAHVHDPLAVGGD